MTLPLFLYFCGRGAPDQSAPPGASDFDHTLHVDFGAATHPGVGGGTHRRRATFDRCKVRGVALRVVVCGVVLVVPCVVWVCSCCVLCVWPVSVITAALLDQWFGPHAITHEVVGSTPASTTSLHVEYAEQRMKYSILFLSSLFTNTFFLNMLVFLSNIGLTRRNTVFYEGGCVPRMRKKKNRSHTQTHDKNNITHVTTRTTPQTTTRRATPSRT